MAGWHWQGAAVLGAGWASSWCQFRPHVMTVVKHLWLGLFYPPALGYLFHFKSYCCPRGALGLCYYIVSSTQCFTNTTHTKYLTVLWNYTYASVSLIFLNIDHQEFLLHFVWLPGYKLSTISWHPLCARNTAVLIQQYSAMSLLSLLPLSIFTLGAEQPRLGVVSSGLYTNCRKD